MRSSMHRRRNSIAVIVVFILLCNGMISMLVAQPGFLSLDCGGLHPYTDNNGISWIPDSKHCTGAATSQAHKLGITKQSTIHNYIAPQFRTLRAFSSLERKNCYMVPVKRGTRYLLRASFLYANYDGAAAAVVTNNVNINYPVFGLSLDASPWATVRIVNATQVYFHEAVGLAVQKYNNPAFAVCLLNLGQGAPFVSSLEVRPLQGGMYNVAPYMNEASFLSHSLRINFGARSSEPVRYPADPVDRIWVSDTAALEQGHILLQNVQAQDVENKNTTHSVDTESAPDRPPESVMQTAVVGKTGHLSYRAVFVGFPKQAYTVAYFAEIGDLGPTESRSFTFSVDNAKNDSTSFVNQLVLNVQQNAGGPYKTYELGYHVVILQETFLSFSFDKGADSAHNPIVNAMEIYEIINTCAPTSVRDESALSEFVKKLPPEASQGDPCLPFSWSWLTCTGSSPPRITSIALSCRNISGEIPMHLSSMIGLQSIYLDSNLLTGPIPDLSTLTTLEILHLQNNQLSGNFPEWLTSLPRLKELWLENNNLVGIVPQRLVKKPGLSFKFSGNPHLCVTLGCDSPSHLRQPHTNVALLAIGIGCSVSIMILILIALVAFIFHRQTASRPPVSSRGSTKMCLIEVGASVIDSPSEGKASTCAEFLQEHQLSSVAEKSIRRFSVADLRVMTKKFSRDVCEGGYGTVFHGRAKDGQEIAVEILARDPCKDAHEFSLEATMLSRLHHQNVVPVIGYCNESREHIVVYEYMQNGPLCDHIHGQSSKAERMDWLTRLNIAIDAAKGLEYLHTECKPSIIHGDVKSSNILLGEMMSAKVLINTLSRVVAPRTTDYLDPEYYQSQQLTAKSDVYSFGVVLLELISGHRLPSQKRQDTSLVIWARELLQVGDLKAIIDPALQQAFCLEAVWKFAELAMCCVEPLRYHRPDMSDVVKELTRIIQVENSGKPFHLDTLANLNFECHEQFVSL